MWCDNCEWCHPPSTRSRTHILLALAGLLVFPLRAGTMALATLIAAYSIAGGKCRRAQRYCLFSAWCLGKLDKPSSAPFAGIIFFMYGQFLWFTYPEVQIYGGISMAVGACSIILLLAFANRSVSATRPIVPLVALMSADRLWSAVWTSALQFLLPFVLFVSAIRAGCVAKNLCLPASCAAD